MIRASASAAVAAACAPSSYLPRGPGRVPPAVAAAAFLALPEGVAAAAEAADRARAPAAVESAPAVWRDAALLEEVLACFGCDPDRVAPMVVAPAAAPVVEFPPAGQRAAAG